MYCIIINSKTFSPKPKENISESIDDVKFTHRCNETMQNYIRFLYWHHNYSADELRNAFPDLIEPKK
jgi:hypothetical protein